MRMQLGVRSGCDSAVMTLSSCTCKSRARTPERPPEGEREQHDDRVQLHPRSEHLGLDDVANEHVRREGEDEGEEPVAWTAAGWWRRGARVPRATCRQSAYRTAVETDGSSKTNGRGSSVATIAPTLGM